MDNHTKYSRDVIANTEESLAKIVAKINSNAVVLDVGCSSGMLGRFLVTQKACIVDGIDIDISALEVCHPIYRKVIIKNLETDDISRDFVAQSYDYIVVADVIEHLNHPDNLLKQLRLLVKPNGSIIFSVPNITHIAASLELLGGQFNYAQNGLLDSTHLRFYSYQGLLQKLADSGIYLWDLDTVQKNVTETEFGDSQAKLFPKAWLDAVISSRPDALVYQWIFSTKIYSCLDVVDQSIRQIKQLVGPIFTTTLYWESSRSNGFNEIAKLLGYKKESAPSEYTVEFVFDHSEQEFVNQIRIDPVAEKKSVWIRRAYVINENNIICWRWPGTRGTDDVGNAYWTDLAPFQGQILCAETNAPQWLPQVPPTVLCKLKSGAKFVMVMCDDSALIDAQLEAAWNKQKIANSLIINQQSTQIQQLLNESNQKDAVLAEVTEYVKGLENQRVESDIFRVEVERILQDRDAHIQQILQSGSWKFTKPFRYLRRKIISVFQTSHLADVSLGTTIEEVNNTEMTFDDFDTKLVEPSNEGIQTSFEQLESYIGETDVCYVPLLNATPLTDKQVKVVCFYLPQFHAIPENDIWWGEGFTEWSNVRPALPQFKGHYQPHVPGELGYYNLLDKSTQQRQIELAKLYGIEGFCFYFYWFGGVRPLEQPLRNYLNDASLDLPFCLCWANENWSRRWDGLNHDILISQQYSEEDDLAFIAHVAQYMRDPRYIRLHGKPLLIVYRPELLPAPKHTADRWRKWCRENGIGEIYLAYTQSFEAVNPTRYDFDAAIEFPPNNSAPPDVTKTVTPLEEDFKSKVYDARVFEARSEAYTPAYYTLYRSVCPSWDNTARRKNNGSIFVHSSPAMYQRWLENAIRNTLITHVVHDERLVFVNAWNEWAEGAHLEPDQRYGYAYLEATRLALIKTSLDDRKINLIEMQKVLAIVIHAYYVDVLDEILDYLDAVVLMRIKLYVTTTPENEAVVRAQLSARQHQFILDVVENRGRDILPFLTIMQKVLKAGHNLFVKVHTKKSLHRIDGEIWRQDLYKKLLTDDAIMQSITIMVQNARIGIIGPEGHQVSMGHFGAKNMKRVLDLSARLGVASDTLMDLSFVAGSMFFARVDALQPLLNLAINPEDFEPENGQVDATLAHAIERMFSVSAHSIGLETTCPIPDIMNTYAFVDQ